jgi:hypothetical protein
MAALRIDHDETLVAKRDVKSLVDVETLTVRTSMPERRGHHAKVRLCSEAGKAGNAAH